MGDFVVFGLKQEPADEILVCFPWAGCGAATFLSPRSPWRTQLPIQVAAIRYPGRETRMKESMPDTVQDLSQNIADEICSKLVGKRVFFYGHSFGAIAAFETARRLPKSLQPKSIIVSGAGGPPIYSRDPISHLSESQFWDEISKMGGTNSELLKSEGMRKLLSPILRMDLRLMEHYKFRSTEMLDVVGAFHCIAGTTEASISDQDLETWQEITTSHIQTHRIGGGHFFFLEHTGSMQDLIAIIDESVKLL